MRFKGYTGVVELDEESGILFGRVIGLRDVITFQGTSVAEVIQAFHDSVDDYLEFCATRGESPEKPYSGQFVAAAILSSIGRWSTRPRRGARAERP